MQIYTDGSKDEQNSCGSGIFIKAPNCSHNIKIRNSDFCSVFRSELIAIDEALRIIKTMTSPDEIWILCDSRKTQDFLLVSLLFRWKIIVWWQHGIYLNLKNVIDGKENNRWQRDIGFKLSVNSLDLAIADLFFLASSSDLSLFECFHWYKGEVE
ncbi:UNVERIFIED_CONTAM: hypothetical protein NCL1_17708 [Trichonephila clavipes]